MQRISVEVQSDFLQRLASLKRPIFALGELVWNAVDADASEVTVEFNRNLLGSLDRIVVSDNGSGMPHLLALDAFKKLGGSWKRTSDRSLGKKRFLHGRAGKGRFRAFALGNVIEWRTRWRENGEVREYTITGRRDALGTFEISDPVLAPGETTGTVVTISEIFKDFPSLLGDDGRRAMTEEFAIYLGHYPEIHITYDGAPIDPAAVRLGTTEVELPPIQTDTGETVTATLTITEWRMPTQRALYLCDQNGFVLNRTIVGIQAPGFEFAAYLRSDYLRVLDDQHLLGLEELQPDLAALLESARAALRDHFRGRTAETGEQLLRDWRAEGVYPYSGEPKTAIETAERHVFDAVAVNVGTYLPKFAEGDKKAQKLSLRMLREVLGESPDAVKRILTDVLGLPLDKQQELAELLERTTLTAIIAASKLVADRLNFVRGLELLVFDPESKAVLLERKQLHKILEQNTWIFGEQFHLTTSDQSLNDVLRKHVALLNRDDVDTDLPVLREDERTGIVDLMLSRTIPQPRAEEHDHLVVELKRPNKKIDAVVLTQVESYAFAVAGDERFRDTATRWNFWAVSNEMTEDARRRAHQHGRPEGLVYDDAQQRIQVWAKTWGELINECKARLQFFQQALEYEASDESAIAHLRQVHAKYLPEHLRAAS